jgi:ACR3 family arsenite efflux pump ArsB
VHGGGVLLGKLAPALTTALSKLEFGQGSQVNVPIAVLIWLMIYPMMLKVDFTALGGIARKPKGLMVRAQPDTVLILRPKSVPVEIAARHI